MRRAFACSLILLPLVASAVSASPASSRYATLAEGPGTHAVVLANGRLLPTRSRPNTLFGVVSFLALDGTAVSLPVSAVDIPATLSREGRRTPSGPTQQLWDERALASLTTRFQAAEIKDAADPDTQPAAEVPGTAPPADLESLSEDLAAQGELPSATPPELQAVNEELMRLQGQLARSQPNSAATRSLRERETLLTAQANDLRAGSGLTEEQ